VIVSSEWIVDIGMIVLAGIIVPTKDDSVEGDTCGAASE